MSKHNQKTPGAGEAKENQKPGEASGTGDSGEDRNASQAGEKQAESGREAAAPEAKTAAQEAEPAAGDEKSAGLVGELEAKLAELNDQYLRKAADLENYRKRTIREKQELSDFANQNLLSDLLPMLDDFERAIKSAETSKDFTSFYDGIKMIEKGLSIQLESKWGLKRFDSEGEIFDPNRHEALQMEKAPGITETVVKEDYVKGYLLKDRVIRYAKVKVLVPDGEAVNNGQGAPNSDL